MEDFVADHIFIDASPDAIFAALVDPESLLEWLSAEEVRVAAGEGGEFSIVREDGALLSGTITRYAPGVALEIGDWWHTSADGRRGPMRVAFSLRPEDGGAWITVYQRDLAGQSGWEDFAIATRQEWVRATVALKRLVEGI